MLPSVEQDKMFIFGKDKEGRYYSGDRLCGLVVTVPGYRSRGPGLDSLGYQIF
jgi:hypothetical protein